MEEWDRLELPKVPPPPPARPTPLAPAPKSGAKGAADEPVPLIALARPPAPVDVKAIRPALDQRAAPKESALRIATPALL